MKKVIIIVSIAIVAIATTCFFCFYDFKKDKVPSPEISVNNFYNVSKSGDSLNVNIKDYVILYDDSINLTLYSSTINQLKSALEFNTNTTIKLCKQSAYKNDTNKKEILIGNTNRTQTISSISKLSSDGFIIDVYDNKIVIAGTNVLQTICAMQEFINNNIPKEVTNTINITTTTTSNNSNLTFISGNSSEYEIVFDKYLDNNPAHKYVNSLTTDNRDYPCVASEQLPASIASATNIDETTFTVRDSSVVGNYELIVGIVDRKLCNYFLTLLDGNEFGIMVKDNTILLLSWNDASLKICIEQFINLLPLAKTQINGVDTWSFPNGFYASAPAYSSWVYNFPRPTGNNINLSASLPCNDKSLQYLYTGAGVNSSSYNYYCNHLIENGYTVSYSHTIEDSQFKNFVNQSKGISLYVAYNDFKYKNDYATNDEFNVDYEKCIRIISSPISAITLPGIDILYSNSSYTKIVNSTITQVPLTSKAVGMGYVIMLEDSSFVIIDGGGVNENGTEHENLWNILSSLYKNVHGAEPTTEKPIVISAWILTHSHGDHYQAFSSMIKTYGSTGLIKMNYLIGNFPEEYSFYSVSASTLIMGKASTISSLKSKIIGGFEYIKIHTGQKLYFANLEIEFLMTFEDHLPRRIDNSNDTCSIFKLTLRNKNNPSSKTTAIFLADGFRFQSRFLCAMYGEYLESDIVQLAHHGNIGCERAVYDAIKPTTVFFPNQSASFKSYTKGTNKQWNYVVDHYVVHLMPSVKYIFVADTNNLTIPSSTTGLKYNLIYDAITNKTIAYDDIRVIKKAD